jgi:hypothetical protein
VNRHVREIQDTVNNMLDKLTIAKLAEETDFHAVAPKPVTEISLGVQ